MAHGEWRCYRAYLKKKTNPVKVVEREGRLISAAPPGRRHFGRCHLRGLSVSVSLRLTYQRLDKCRGLREVWFLVRCEGEPCRQATRGEAQRTGSLLSQRRNTTADRSAIRMLRRSGGAA